ncbi:CMGC/CDK protein kinase [Allomyces macrogynus ATCC 38327]|uniref:CMGC/CDK protein kinase n=1 Tax=Allomyces macrogynus (strain ATCC 38327) TaxID=578462 RepID=A0A0L0SKT6_ALLM3|nr:CMGC/CDK protein kinase [Allomyces macrogynus ATCC 38327]|eukprot:KNE62994.1 CMGC/CDK protein kinase [Allomyces macrogynus ATCC 38327]
MASAAEKKRSRWLADDDDDQPKGGDLRSTLSRSKGGASKKRKASSATSTKTDAAPAPATTSSAPAAPTAPTAAPTARRRALSPAPPPPPPAPPAPPARLATMTPAWIQSCRSVEHYEKLNRIDEGAYGVVYRARDRSTGEIVALKRLKLDQERHGFPVTALREISSLLRLRAHPHIVHAREVVVGGTLTSVFLVMEFLEHDVKGLLTSMPMPFLASEVKTLIAQLLAAVAFLHARGRVHRDLKTSNLLLNNQGMLKVADFGLTRVIARDAVAAGVRPLTPLVVTLWYRGPELLLGADTYDATAVDMWSVGCIFAELITRTPLVPGRGEIDQIDKVFMLLGRPSPAAWKAMGDLPHAKNLNLARYAEWTGEAAVRARLRAKVPGLSEQGADLLAKMLEWDPKRRISAQDALEHAYFREHPPAKDPAMFPTFPSRANGEMKQRDSPSAPVAAHDVDDAPGGRIPDDDDDGGGGGLFSDAAVASVAGPAAPFHLRA